jgi:hypothetical protein
VKGKSVPCWNCGQRIPAKAKACQFCEAEVARGNSEEDTRIVRDILEQMPQEALDQLQAAFDECGTAEEFANRIMVGECPRCGSPETGNCDSDPDIGELLVGRCYQCGQLWCTECGQLLDRNSPACECWDEEI